ncbi:MAG: PP2C family protein-serine/threonine phosphatase [Acidobacteriaceae bacterium]|nr:PP2C family protein-serine/threonine phosphatase [Acidobacteriaceae bacterium]
MTSDDIPRQVASAALRANLPFFAIACITLVAGIACLLLARLRSRDRLLFWVGIFSVLYAIRLLIENELARDAFNSPGLGYLGWNAALTYIIAIPFAAFARELFGRGWKGTIAIWLWLEMAFALIALTVLLTAHQTYWTDIVNSVLIIAGVLVILFHVVRIRREGGNPFAASLAWPIVIFGAFVVFQNRYVLGVRGISSGVNLEPIGFLVLLAGLATTAVRRAIATERKLIDVEQELATARRIQCSIIPQTLPVLPSLRLAARYQPMTSVAGDFYDFLKCGDHLLTILVADVSGHGVPAALVASMLKVCFAAQRETAQNPAEILARINSMLRGSLGGQYVTASCAAINIEQRVILYSGAGHPPALLLRKNAGEVIELDENGLFLGPFPDSAYANRSVPFDRGDKLLLYTDGIVEATGPDGREFGYERLEQFVLQAASEEPAALIDQLIRKISNGGAQQDDLTVVLAQFD